MVMNRLQDKSGRENIHKEMYHVLPVYQFMPTKSNEFRKRITEMTYETN